MGLVNIQYREKPTVPFGVTSYKEKYSKPWCSNVSFYQLLSSSDLSQILAHSIAPHLLPCGFLFLTPLFLPFNPLTLDRQINSTVKTKGEVVFRILLLIKGIEFLGASLVFNVQMLIPSFFSFAQGYLTKLDPQQPITKNQYPITRPASQGPSLYIPSEKSQNSQRHTIIETVCNKIMTLREHKANPLVNCCGQSEAAQYPTSWIKMKTFSHNISVFF